MNGILLSFNFNMNSFGWKKRINTGALKVSSIFKTEEDEEVDANIDWLTASKRPKVRFIRSCYAELISRKEHFVNF